MRAVVERQRDAVVAVEAVGRCRTHARRRRVRPPAGTSQLSRDERQHERGRRRQGGEGEPGLGAQPVRGGARSRSRRVRATSAKPIPAKRLVVDPDVAAAPAVRDRRAAADVRLEHGEPSGRVDEGVGCREPLAHVLREPDHAHARLRARSARAAAGGPRCGHTGTRRPRRRAAALRPPRSRDHPRPSLRPRRGRSSPSQAGRGSARGAASQASRTRVASGRARPRRRCRPGDLADLLDHGGVDDEVQVDSRRGPPVHHREVGDRPHHRHREPARSAAARRAPRSRADTPRRSTSGCTRRIAAAAPRDPIRARAPARHAASARTRREPERCAILR